MEKLAGIQPLQYDKNEIETGDIKILNQLAPE